MLNCPKTLEEARQIRYGKWSGKPNGNAYQEGRCAYKICNGWISSQCFNKNGKGINNLYCGVHAKKI